MEGFGLLCRLSETTMLPTRILERTRLIPSTAHKQPFPTPRCSEPHAPPLRSPRHPKLECVRRDLTAS